MKNNETNIKLMTLNCILVYPNKLLFILKIFSYNIHQSILGIIMGNKSKKSKLIIPANKDKAPKEIGGRKGPEPTRYGDWEKNGRCIDF